METTEAIRVWNFIANGTGGADWQALPLAVEFYGVSDVEGCIERLLIVKSHKKPKEDDGPGNS